MVFPNELPAPDLMFRPRSHLIHRTSIHQFILYFWAEKKAELRLIKALLVSGLIWTDRFYLETKTRELCHFICPPGLAWPGLIIFEVQVAMFNSRIGKQF